MNGVSFITLAKRSFEGTKVRVENCRSSWVPFFIYVGIEILNVIKDKTFCDEFDVLKYCKSINREKLRLFLETTATSSMLVADALYQLDYSEAKPVGFDNGILDEERKITVATWQTYGRSYIQELDKKIEKYQSTKPKLMILPCTGSKPYNHNNLNIEEYKNQNYHKLVITSIGIIPEEFWLDPTILTYTTGVPDIWRVYNLVKQYFIKNKYNEILCYLDYTPYIEIMELINKEFNLNIKFIHKKKYKTLGPKFTREFK